MKTFEFKGLPKMSLNKLYESRHWRHRKKMKDLYSLILMKHYHCIDCTKQYDVDYEFFFESQPLDSSNTAAMIKMIEDVLFEKDGYKVVRRISTISNRGTKDLVRVTVKEL